MRVRRLATVATVLLLVSSAVACGDPASRASTGSSTAATGTAPATASAAATVTTTARTTTTTTTTATTSTSPSTTAACPPARNDVAPNPADAAAYEALAADAAAVSAYGSEHPDDWGGSSIMPATPPRITAYVTRDRDTHEAALRKIVAHPDLLDVLVGRYTVRDLAGLRGEIEANVLQQPGAPPMVLSIGDGLQTVSLDLAPGREGVAAALSARYGSAVRLDVAGMPYVPPGCGDQPIARRCADIAGVDPASVGLALKVEAYNPTMAPWEFGHGALTVENVGTRRYMIDPGNPIEGVLVEPGTTHVVGRNAGGIAGTGLNLDLAPGDKGGVEIVFGAARCDGKPGTALPPGTYGLRVVLIPEGPAADGVAGVLSPELPITITAG